MNDTMPLEICFPRWYANVVARLQEDMASTSLSLMLEATKSKVNAVPM